MMMRLSPHGKTEATKSNLGSNRGNIFNDFPQYDKILFLLAKTSNFIKTENNEFKNVIYFNLGKLHELMPECYNSKINLNKSYLDNNDWNEAYILIEDIIKEITNYT